MIGTGMAGATLGHALAKAGKSVLFCERGKALPNGDVGIAGRYPEESRRPPEARARDASMETAWRDAGRSLDPVFDRSSWRSRDFVPFLGATTGGSTALYGMALERFFPSDFRPRVSHREAVGSSLPETWPISYADLERFYSEAEALYRVRGGKDPLRTGPSTSTLLEPEPLTNRGRALFEFLCSQELHPYRLPQACEFLPGCLGCQGFRCPRACKNDSARICLYPAIERHDAVLLDECEVVHLEADRRRVTEVRCRRRGESVRLRGSTVVLAAGALQSPNLLLRSSSVEWPQGLANKSGLVGRNLMRHCIDLYLVRPPGHEEAQVPDSGLKEVAFNDFYEFAGAKLGSVQSFGQLPPADVLFASMQEDAAHLSPLLAKALGLARSLVVPQIGRTVSGYTVLASICEDLPYHGNCVRPTSSGGSGAVEMEYRLQRYEQRRLRQFRGLMADLLKGRQWRLLKQAANNQRLAHACGTCRFGMDPASSVLDAHNRAHDLDNLYVVDSSFFPSSGGTNPSLTIAANALRVAAELAR